MASPTITTQAVSGVQSTAAIGNGNITDTGGENATRRGVCYMIGTSGDPTTANSVAYEDGSFGTGAYATEMPGLAADTNYRVRAYAVNPTGTGYGATVQTQTLEGGIYDITEIDKLEHDIVGGTYNSFVMIDSTHFILAYTHSNSQGYIKTFSIDGSFNITEIDSLEHNAVFGWDNSLVMIDNTHFILAYGGYVAGYDTRIKTFSIDGSFNITEIDELIHDTTIIYDVNNSLVMIDTTHFILAYAKGDYHGCIKTFSIDGSYNITELQSLEHDAVSGYYNSLVMIDTTHFILAYMGDGYDGYIKTFSIDGSYNITELHDLEHDTIQGTQNSFVMIDSTHFILAYAKGNDHRGYIKTFSIDGNYDIVQINSLEHDAVSGYYNSFVMIDTTHFILAYCKINNDGCIKTFEIDGNYNITELHNLEYDTVADACNSLIKIDAIHFILAYTGDGNDGFIKTFQITQGKELIDTFAVAEDFTALKVIIKVITDTFAVGESIYKKTAKAFTDTFTASETIFKKTAKAFVDTFAVSETITKLKKYVKILVDTFRTTENFYKLRKTLASWINKVKNSVSFTNKSKNTTAFTNKDKNSTDFTNKDKPYYHQ